MTSPNLSARHPVPPALAPHLPNRGEKWQQQPNKAIELAGGFVGGGLALGGGAVGAAIGDGLAGSSLIRWRRPPAGGAGRLQTLFFLTVGLVEAMYFINLAFAVLFVFVLANGLGGAALMATQVVAAGNFLVPNATFIAELVAFLLILSVLWRYIVPPIQKAMQDRQEMIAKQVEDSEEAQKRWPRRSRPTRSALSEARTEAAQIRENARAEAQRMVEDLRDQAQEEQARIIARGEEQLERQRASIVRELRAEIGTLAVELSEKIVGQQLSRRR